MTETVLATTCQGRERMRVRKSQAHRCSIVLVAWTVMMMVGQTPTATGQQMMEQTIAQTTQGMPVWLTF